MWLTRQFNDIIRILILCSAFQCQSHSCFPQRTAAENRTGVTSFLLHIQLKRVSPQNSFKWWMKKSSRHPLLKLLIAPNHVHYMSIPESITGQGVWLLWFLFTNQSSLLHLLGGGWGKVHASVCAGSRGKKGKRGYQNKIRVIWARGRKEHVPKDIQRLPCRSFSCYLVWEG